MTRAQSVLAPLLIRPASEAAAMAKKQKQQSLCLRRRSRTRSVADVQTVLAVASQTRALRQARATKMLESESDGATPMQQVTNRCHTPWPASRRSARSPHAARFVAPARRAVLRATAC